MRTLTLLLFLALGGCGSSNSTPDMHLLGEGELCTNGIGGQLGTCASGLKCCLVYCNQDGGVCLDLPSRCTATPPPGSAGCD